MEQITKIHIAGHIVMVSSGLEGKLSKEGYDKIVARILGELNLST